jgi:uncharacterized NAD-dependent epimerase/dehydratase family protein
MLKEYYDIVILDTGINKAHEFFSNPNNFDSYKLIYNENLEFELILSENDNYGHGTAISSIIDKFSPNSQKLVINFYEITNNIDEITLIKVLNYIYENISGKILNVSLGLEFCEYCDELQDVCKKLLSKGFVIIGALGNLEVLSYPAVFPEVIGVTTDKYITNYTDFTFFENNEEINIAGFGINQRLPWKNDNEYNYVSGSSFTCAYISALATNICLSKSLNLNLMKEELKKLASKIEVCTKPIEALCKNNLFTIEKAVLFPFNKEMHSLVRFEDMLDFEIKDIFDVKYSMKIGKTTNYLMTDPSVKTYVIHDWENIDWNSFDTLILGHCSELELHISKEILSTICKIASEKGKQIFAFDNLEYFLSESFDSNKIQFPSISTKNLVPNRINNYIYNIGIPSVCILGTGSQQGKFTLQLEIFKRLEKKGYNIGCIGTEPSSLLYGMDYVYPIGFNCHRSVSLNDYEVVRYLNSIMHELEVQKKDLILTASQAGTIPKANGYISTYSLKQSTFLKAIWPDVAILCVNYDDDLNYIKRTIKYVESVVNCKVIAITILPFAPTTNVSNIAGFYKKSLLKHDEIKKFKENLYNELSINVFSTNNITELDKLTEHIINSLQ